LLSTNKIIPRGATIKCLDIGVGANCIYPIIGAKEYGWSFVGSDIDPISIVSANKILKLNPELEGNIEIRQQRNQNKIFEGIVREKERFHISICNPPFHSSAKEAQAGNVRKLRNLKGKKVTKAKLNFGGQNNELWCNGGEKQFISNMIKESFEFANSCLWFSTLVSKEANLPDVYKSLKRINVQKIKTIEMGQGSKKSRIVAWTFHA